MKSFLLTAVTLIACAGGVFAQYFPPVYSWEIGVNGGYSVMTRPLGPPSVYQGNSTHIVNDFSICGNYFFNENWMISLDIGTRHWETFGQWQMNERFNTKLDPVDVNFVVAEQAISENVKMNYVIPFYTQFRTYNRANLYFGVNAGFMNTVNDGSKGYSYMKSPIDSSTIEYVTTYHYASGMGYNFGVQGGFTYNIIPRLGVNIELGVRYANITTIGQNAAADVHKYHLMYFPETLGIRWRL